ncbi:GATA-binding factor 2-like [Melanotaenia boesemani]|uniref:GATA-binding factor 2-like n=1 Tax=Melanotaenia boesemani TaxID=1250792 RepID=UPI001C046482|nr:GATA-binding factor 2-like [Melanotaenia boesemani]XP_041858798.1 GATA-binding factor 2-like [Melanotaenia boesemani]
MSAPWPSPDWSSAAPNSRTETSSGSNAKFGSSPLDALLQSPCSEASPQFLSRPPWLDHLSSANSSPALSSSLYGHLTLTPPPISVLPSATRWNTSTPPPSCSGGWTPPDSVYSGFCCSPGWRVCVSCGVKSSPLWRRDASGQHLCNTCSLQQEDSNNTPLLRQRRRTTMKKSQCVNCETKTTSLWRKNKDGQSVCNACGLYYRLHQVQRPLTLKKDGVRTRNRKVNKNKKRTSQSESRFSWLAPPSQDATFSSFVQQHPPPFSSSSSSSSLQ